MVLAVNDLKGLTVPELKKALLERKLNVTGKKQDLINRLTEYMQQEAAKAEEVTEQPESEEPATAISSSVELPVVSEPTKENVSFCSR